MEESQLIRRELLPDGVALLTLSNPPLNLNTLQSIAELHEHCRQLSTDTSVRAVVVTGDGDRAFCAGSDINEFADVRDSIVEKKLAAENAAFTALEQLPQPVIAALNGVTLGGGSEIALACDLRVMDERTCIGFPEVKLGVFPGSGGVFRLPRIVGTGIARRLLFTGDAIDAHEAFRIHLVEEIAPPAKALPFALELATRLSAGPALALSLIKHGLIDSALHTTEEATTRTLLDSHRVFTGPDIEEGMTAFFDRRTPEFTSPDPRDKRKDIVK